MEFADMFAHVGDFRAKTVREKCSSNEHLIMLASQLAYQAALIYEQVGGKKLVAAQFYNMADKAVIEPSTERE